MIDLIKSSKPSWSRWYFKVYLTTSTGFRNCIAVQLLLYGWYTAYFISVWFFFRKFFCEIAGGKRAGKYLLLHMWCLPTCQKSIGIDDMKLNYSEYSNRLCQNIAYCEYVQKKSWKFRMVSANASCSPGVLTSFLDQLQKDTIWL